MSQKPVFWYWRHQKLIFEERDHQKEHLDMITSRMVPKLCMGDFPIGLWSGGATACLATPSKKKKFFLNFFHFSKQRRSVDCAKTARLSLRPEQLTSYGPDYT
jgi:hypothetical protein